MESIRSVVASVTGFVALGLAHGFGCGLDTSGAITSGPPDATDDVVIDRNEPLSCNGWRPRFFDPCTLGATGAPVALASGGTIVYDTDLPGFVEDPPADPPSTIVDQGGTPAVVISVESFTVAEGTTLRVVGDKPLIIASWSAITIAGTVDAGSHREDRRAGAGANPKLCEETGPGLGDDDVTGGGSGGGGGGSFAGTGGKGGPGDTGGENPGGDGGQMVGTPTIVRGGCAGAASGMAGNDDSVSAPSNSMTRAPGGAGGGAIQLSARQVITISGRVLAGGAGGTGAPLNSAVGGGGGGSGGWVGFDAPLSTFAPTARLAANGGGGGSSDSFSSTGDPGADGGDDATPAAGGVAGSCATAGAPGAAGATTNGPSSAQSAVSCGGGGGGGSVGYIIVIAPSFTAPAGAIFSPPPTVVN